LPGIDNSKFQPIIRELIEVKIELPFCKIPTLNKTVNKMIKELTKYAKTEEISAHQGGNTPMAQ
jgi:hypothetical protein